MSLPNSHKHPPNSLDLILWNANSLNPERQKQLEIFSSSVKPAIIAITESKFGPGSTKPQLRSYSCHSRPFRRSESGICVFTLDSLPTSRRTDLESYSPHCLWLEFKPPGSSTA